jgi:RNA polymerase sigma factor (sigma-70 family)
LQRFVSQRDQDAFATLVRRHAPLVWGTCRRVLGQRQDAEDAFQATFLVLARKANAVSWQSSVGGWLYTVAQRLSVRARRQDARRRALEQQASQPAMVEGSLRELGAVVDEELQRLPEKYRLPLLLHYLEGKTAEETARELGHTRGTFYNRLSRGLELLRGRLTRRGLTLSASLLSVALAWEAEAAPPKLLQAALAITSRGVPEPVAALALRGLPNPSLTKLKVALALCLALGTVAGGMAAWMHQVFESPPPKVAQPKESEKRLGRVDRQGDPLPDGAIARLGTLRWRAGDEVQTLAFSPDGKTIAAATLGEVCLFDANNGKRLKLLRDSGPNPRGITFSPDGKQLAGFIRVLTHLSGEVRVWDLASGRKVRQFETEYPLWLGWSSAGQPRAIRQGRGEIYLRELATGKEQRFPIEILPHLWKRATCAHSDKGKVVAAIDKRGVVHVWNTTTGKELHALKPNAHHVFDLVLSSDGRWLASLGSEKNDKRVVQLWDATMGKATHAVGTDQNYLAGAAFTPDGKILATVGWNEVRFWDVANGRELARTKSGGRSFASSIAFSPDGKTLVTNEKYSGALHRWDVASGAMKPEPVGHSSWPNEPAISPDGRRVATGDNLNGRFFVWNPATGEQLASVHGSQWVRGCAFLSDGKTLYSAWAGHKLIFSDAANGRELHALKLEDPDRPNTQQSGMYLHLSKDGKTLIALSHYDVKKRGKFFPELLVTGWDTATRKQLFRRRRVRDDFSIAISEDAKMLAASQRGDPDALVKEAPGTGPMQLEDLATGEHLLTFPTLKGQSWPLAFSPDGRLLASYTGDGKSQKLRVWEVATASEVLALDTTSNSRAAFSPDGRVLALSAPSQTIQLWDLRRGKEVRRIKGLART